TWVPEFDDAVDASAGNRFSVGTVRDTRDGVLMSAEDAQLFPGCRVQEFDRLIPISAGDSFGVRAQRHRHVADIFRIVKSEHTDQSSVVNVKNPDRGIPASGSEGSTIGADAQGLNN